MKKVIKNNYKFILGIIIGLIISITTVYAVEAYIESNKVSFDNKHTKTNNVQDAIDELYERSGMHKDKWVDKELNGADPVLQYPLIPVEINDDGEAYYANENSEWYNYSEKRWANAVILIDNPSNKNYGVGDHILKDDIQSYFVWIPRYKYKVWNKGDYTKAISFSELQDMADDTENKYAFRNVFGKPKIIEVIFGDAEHVREEKGTKKGSNISGGDADVQVGEYLIHPAFTLGEKELKGFWIGKFETGYKGATSTAQAEVDNIEPENVIIKPNVYTWRNATVKKMFMTAYNYKRDLDSHMLKNTEWGAVAYLSHSQYGIGTEPNTNNNENYMTGYSSFNASQNTYPGVLGSDDSTTRLWNNEIGYLASTTGNISGVYDMRGGTWEYVAACVESSPGRSEFSEAELETEMKNGYIDRYNKNENSALYNNRILGDATGEMGPFYNFKDADGNARNHGSWYNDFSYIVRNDNSWYGRGGHRMDGIVSGLFCFALGEGEKKSFGGFRLVLSPN